MCAVVSRWLSNVEKWKLLDVEPIYSLSLSVSVCICAFIFRTARTYARNKSGSSQGAIPVCIFLWPSITFYSDSSLVPFSFANLANVHTHTKRERRRRKRKNNKLVVHCKSIWMLPRDGPFLAFFSDRLFGIPPAIKNIVYVLTLFSYCLKNKDCLLVDFCSFYYYRKQFSLIFYPFNLRCVVNFVLFFSIFKRKKKKLRFNIS